MNAQDLFSAGKLPEAITAALEQVRNKPTDVNARFFLAELLCFDGAWERADKQMDVLMQQASEPNMFAILFRQLVRGEVAREQIFRDGRAPELMVQLPEYAQDQIRICLEFRVGDLAAAKSLADRVVAARPQYQGQVNGKPFSGGVRDLDDRIGTVAEFITAHGSRTQLAHGYAGSDIRQFRKARAHTPPRERSIPSGRWSWFFPWCR